MTDSADSSNLDHADAVGLREDDVGSVEDVKSAEDVKWDEEVELGKDVE
jgi:hypothetical protein